MKMLEVRQKTSVFRYRLEWLNTMDVTPTKAGKGKPDIATLSIVLTEPGVLRSGLTIAQIGALNLGMKVDFEFATVDEALAAVHTIEI